MCNEPTMWQALGATAGVLAMIAIFFISLFKGLTWAAKEEREPWH